MITFPGNNHYLLLTTLLLLALYGCSKPNQTENPELASIRYQNLCATILTSDYFLWADEATGAIGLWDNEINVADNLQRVRLASGHDDPWTGYIEDFPSTRALFTGSGYSFGFGLRLYNLDPTGIQTGAAVLYTIPGSPAAAAGLKRGDIITAVNDKPLTRESARQIIQEGLYSAKSATLTLRDGKTVIVNASSMVRKSVLYHSVFDYLGRPTGYLILGDFTPTSCAELLSVLKEFQDNHIQTLILDLRYSTKGLAVMDTFLASLLTYKLNAQSAFVYEKEYTNDRLESIRHSSYVKYHLTPTMDIDDSQLGSYHFSADGIDWQWLDETDFYFITSGLTAGSADYLIRYLMESHGTALIGEATSGISLNGIMVSFEDWYRTAGDSTLGENSREQVCSWVRDKGIALTVSNSFPLYIWEVEKQPYAPNYSVSDNPFDGHELGDRKETLFAAALEYISAIIHAATPPASAPNMLPDGFSPCPEMIDPGFGIRLISKERLINGHY